MRKLNLAILGVALLGAATAGWAAEPPAAPPTASVSVEESLTLQAAPEPASIDLLFSNPQTPAQIILCPEEPVVTCNECFSFGQWYTYRCTLYCVNGSPRRTCGSCGSGCDP